MHRDHRAEHGGPQQSVRRVGVQILLVAQDAAADEDHVQIAGASGGHGDDVRGRGGGAGRVVEERLGARGQIGGGLLQRLAVAPGQHDRPVAADQRAGDRHAYVRGPAEHQGRLRAPEAVTHGGRRG
jgi:hypothetical protein